MGACLEHSSIYLQCKSAELSKFHKSMKKAGHGTDRPRRLSRTTTIHTLKNDGITSRADRGQFTSNQENFELVRCRLRFIFDSCFKSFKISVNIQDSFRKPVSFETLETLFSYKKYFYHPNIGYSLFIVLKNEPTSAMAEVDVSIHCPNSKILKNLSF